ncbi:hypothetical protein T492DRAFT_859654 [Pavlovales sp. CCMP2436]|nr:hypothetical protein T492DRAFT_859654 [Pavlovales sp. CCMP2436]
MTTDLLDNIIISQWCGNDFWCHIGRVNHYPLNDTCPPCRSEDCQFAHAVPKDDGSAHARVVPRLKEVTELVLAAHLAGRHLAPKTQVASRNGSAGGNSKWAEKARK